MWGWQLCCVCSLPPARSERHVLKAKPAATDSCFLGFPRSWPAMASIHLPCCRPAPSPSISDSSGECSSTRCSLKAHKETKPAWKMNFSSIPPRHPGISGAPTAPHRWRSPFQPSSQPGSSSERNARLQCALITVLTALTKAAVPPLRV